MRVATKLIQDKVHQIVKHQKNAEAEAAPSQQPPPTPLPSQMSQTNGTAGQTQPAPSQPPVQTTPMAQGQQLFANPQSATGSTNPPVLQNLGDVAHSSVPVSTDSGICGMALSETNSSLQSETAASLSSQQVPTAASSQQPVLPSATDTVSNNMPSANPTSMQPIANSLNSQSQLHQPKVLPAHVSGSSSVALSNAASVSEPSNQEAAADSRQPPAPAALAPSLAAADPSIINATEGSALTSSATTYTNSHSAEV